MRMTRNQFASGDCKAFQLRSSLYCSVSQQFLDSLVVRISACHVEGPGSIPGRGEKFFPITFRCKNAGKIGGASFVGPFKGRLSVQTLTFIVMGKRWVRRRRKKFWPLGGSNP